MIYVTNDQTLTSLFFFNELHLLLIKNIMSKEKSEKKKSDKTPPAKSAKEKKIDKASKKKDKESEGRNATA